jgi:hypothetical protein
MFSLYTRMFCTLLQNRKIEFFFSYVKYLNSSVQHLKVLCTFTKVLYKSVWQKQSLTRATCFGTSIRLETQDIGSRCARLPSSSKRVHTILRLNIPHTRDNWNQSTSIRVASYSIWMEYRRTACLHYFRDTCVATAASDTTYASPPSTRDKWLPLREWWMRRIRPIVSAPVGTFRGRSSSLSSSALL